MMRVVYEGGAAWQAAERNFPPLEEGAYKPLCSPLARATEERLTRFVRRWRAHFVAAVRPRALPSHWCVHYPVVLPGTRVRGKTEAALVREFAEQRP
jgi:hypothetical protein